MTLSPRSGTNWPVPAADDVATTSLALVTFRASGSAAAPRAV